MRAVFVLALAAGLSFQHSAYAQSDTRGLVDRLDRLERDLNTLQGQVYRNGGGPTVITSPALGGGTSGGGNSGGARPSGSLSGDAYSLLDDRINNLENQLRDMTGQLEKTSFSANQLSAKIDRMQADNDFRLKELEGKAGGGSGGGAPAPAGAPAASGGANKSAAGANDAQPAQQGPGAAPGFLGRPASGTQAQANAAAPAAAAPALVGKTSQEQFDYAFGLLKNSDNAGASRAFQAFVAQHPQDPLAGNAMYWLAQISYAQGQYDQAAVTFLDAYRKYPKSAKAGESLLKVGLSMSNLGKKKEACAALSRFSSEYPDAADNLRRLAASERQKLGC
ncbi:tol-pal system protein YbgF [Telmatospirillum siberiense]|nr:tol-pal system protein YbgF [Telmatospirillum siberiense]